MKTLSKKIGTTLLYTGILLGAMNANAQSKAQVAVLNIDAKGLTLEPEQIGNLVRVELAKTNLFNVMDKYDVKDMAEKNKISLDNCYGRQCLTEVGKVVKADKMLSGAIERYGEKIVITLRLVDVGLATVEKTQVNEFLNLQPQIQSMITITVRNMFGLQNDTMFVNRLTKESNYESTTNNPGVERLQLNGPRMGVTYLIGEKGNRTAAPKNVGGYNVSPVMTQFGYQLEVQYLNAGNFQALVEFIPMITGIDQQMFIPSITFLNGFRNNKSGWEFAFGPAIGFMRVADGYYDNNRAGGDNKWHLKEEWDADSTHKNISNPNTIFENLDSRGLPKLTSGFVLACGKTFKSGSLNIPVNVYVIPDIKEGSWRFGASFGFNTKNRNRS